MGWLSKAWNAVTGTVKAIISNPVTAIASVALAIYAPAVGLRLLGSMLVSNVLNAVTAKDPQTPTDGGSTAQQGSSQVLPFATTNKLPVIYGTGFVSGFLTDAKISTDNQTMWYVISVCEAPDSGEATVTFGDMYWNEQRITFSSSEYGRVIKLTNNAGQEDTKIDGNLWIYPYNGSSTPLTLNGLSSSTTAFTRLQDTAIPAAARWGNTEAMTGTVFYIVKCVYSTDDNMTGLGALLAEVKINQTGVTGGYRPGAAMIDYLTNTRYGAGLDPDKVNAQSFANLDSYSDVLINFSQFGGGTASQPRYRFNGVLDTTQTVMSNLIAMADSCDAYIQFNEALGQWSVVTNKSVLQYPNIQTYDSLFRLDDTNIIGGVNIVPLDLNSTPNEVESGFNDGANRGRMNYAYASTPDNLKSVNEPVNKLSITYKFVNDSVRAQYLSNRKLEQCRADYIVQLTADYSAIQIDAGDVVALTYKPYGNNLNGWGDNKLFRVTQVTENRADNGDLTVGLHLMEYAEAVYDDRNITEFSPPSGGVVLDPRLLAKPGTPTFPDATVLPSGNPPTFVVQSEVPRSGVTVAMEFWYGPTQEITNNNYILYNTEYNSGGNQYAISAAGAEVYERETVSGLPEGTWYWRVRAIGTSRKSDFSDAAEIIWAPVAADSNLGDAKGNAQKSTAQIVPFEYNTAWPNNTRGIRPAGGVTVIPTAKPGSIHINFSASVYANTNSEFNCLEVWKNKIQKTYKKTILAIRHSQDYSGGSIHRLQAIGTGGIDLSSDDGGVTWTTVDTSSMVTGGVTYSATDAFPYFYSSSLYQTHVVGAAQTAAYSATSFYNYGYRWQQGAGDIEPFAISYQYILSDQVGVVDDIKGSVNAVAAAPGTGIEFTPASTGEAVTTIVVGDNGLVASYIALTRQSGGYPMSAGNGWKRENGAGTLQNLHDVFCSPQDGSRAYTAIAVGKAGTIIKSSRNSSAAPSTGNTFTWSGKSAYDFDGTTALSQTLTGVASDNAANTSTSKWVAVGLNGVILSSLDNGETWTRRECLDSTGEQLGSDLHGVRYGNGKWVVCGSDGIIYTSTDTVTWTLITATVTGVATGEWPRNLYTVCWAPNHGRFSIGGENIILNSPDTTLSFTNTYTQSADESSNLTRLWYRGSHANILTVTAVEPANRLINGQTVSSTIIDTDYKKTDEIQYLLVIGNMNSNLVYADAPTITAVEYKK